MLVASTESCGTETSTVGDGGQQRLGLGEGVGAPGDGRRRDRAAEHVERGPLVGAEHGRVHPHAGRSAPRASRARRRRRGAGSARPPDRRPGSPAPPARRRARKWLCSSACAPWTLGDVEQREDEDRDVDERGRRRDGRGSPLRPAPPSGAGTCPPVPTLPSSRAEAYTASATRARAGAVAARGGRAGRRALACRRDARRRPRSGHARRDPDRRPRATASSCSRA